MRFSAKAKYVANYKFPSLLKMYLKIRQKFCTLENNNQNHHPYILYENLPDTGKPCRAKCDQNDASHQGLPEPFALDSGDPGSPMSRAKGSGETTRKCRLPGVIAHVAYVASAWHVFRTPPFITHTL